MRRGLAIAASFVLLCATAAPGSAADIPISYLERGDNGRFSVVYDDGSGPNQVSSIDSLTAPAISPDGSRIAFAGVVGDGSLGRYSLYTARIDGAAVSQITDGSFGELDPAWSPDGNRLVFSLNELGSYSPHNCCRLATVTLSSGAVSNLTADVGATRPSWSPDGSLITFDTPSGVHTIPASGGQTTRRASGGFDSAFSPDSDRIAYVWRSGSSYSLRVLTMSTGSASTVYTTSRTIESPRWIGDRIYFIQYRGVGYDSRSAVSLRSVYQFGGSVGTETSFKEVVAELDLAESRIPRLGVVAGDVDQDGDHDLVYRDCGSFPTICWQVRLSTTSGFGSGQNWGNGVFFSPETDTFGVETGDLDSDGDYDLVYRGFCGSVGNKCWRVQRSTGSGFPTAEYWGDGAFFSPESATYGFDVGDLDGDGNHDLVYRAFCGFSGNKCWRVQLSTGSTFGGAQNWGDSAFFSHESDDYGVELADVNGDGLSDLVYRAFCGSSSNKCWRVQLSTGSSFTSAQNWGDGLFSSPDSADFGLVTGDVDGDGLDDLVYRGFCGVAGNDCWRVQLSTGSGFSFGQDWGNGAFFSPESKTFGLTLADVDGDGDDDLVYRGFCGTVGNTCWRVQLSTGTAFAAARNWGQ